MARRIAGQQPAAPAAQPVAPPGPPVAAAGQPTAAEPVAATGYVEQPREAYADRGRERPWSDRVRWGPLWAGLITTIATFTLLQLIFIATKAVDVDLGGNDTSFSFWTALSALLAFFVGGLVTGASTKWDREDDGALHGVLLWALATVALLILGGISARALAGPIGGFLNSVGGAGAIAEGPGRDRAIEAAQDRAAQALISLFLALVAAVAGAVVGSKLWPRRVGPRGRGAGWGTGPA